MCALGDCFLNDDSTGLPQHLRIVASDPSKDAAEVVLLNVTTDRGLSGTDKACTLQAGDHSFIRHDSYISYADAKTTALENIRSLVAAGKLIPRPPSVAADVLARIQSGSAVSIHAPISVAKLLKSQGFLP